MTISEDVCIIGGMFCHLILFNNMHQNSHLKSKCDAVWKILGLMLAMS